MKPDIHYDHEVVKHDPREGFDPTEPAAPRITIFVVVSVLVLGVVIFALQNYFDAEWVTAVDQKVLSAPAPELRDLRSLENWRLTHYEYTTETKSEVRLPLDQARALVLADAKAGKTFYPAKPTTPKPEIPAAPAPADAEKK